MAKKKATTTRKAAAPKKTAKAKRTRMSVNQMLQSNSEAMKLAGCITLASACMREGKSPKEAKRIQNQKTTIVDSLRNNLDSKQVEEFMKKVRASNQRIYKALVSCNRTKEVENFFEAARATFKGASKSKSLPATI